MEYRDTIALRREPGPLVRSLVALSLRVGLGLLFLMAGLQKFQAMHTGKYPAMIVDQFAKSRLRGDMVLLFAKLLPYVEVSLGGLLIAGLFTTLTAALVAVVLLHLFFGKLILNDVASYPGMFVYLLTNAGTLWLSPVTSNYLSLDGLLFGWYWAPRVEGYYEREEEPAPEPAPQPPPPPPPAPRRTAPPARSGPHTPPRTQSEDSSRGFFIS